MLVVVVVAVVGLMLLERNRLLGRWRSGGAVGLDGDFALVEGVEGVVGGSCGGGAWAGR